MTVADAQVIEKPAEVAAEGATDKGFAAFMQAAPDAPQTPPEQPKASEKPAAAPSPDPAPAEQAQDADVDYNEAFKRLQLAGFDASDIKVMSKASVVKLWKTQEKREADINRKLEEARQLKAAAKQQTPQAGSETPAPAESKQQKAQPLAELTGDADLAAAIEAEIERRTAPLVKQLESVTKAEMARREALVRERGSDAAKEVGEVFPDIHDTDKFDADIRDRFSALMQPYADKGEVPTKDEFARALRAAAIAAGWKETAIEPAPKSPKQLSSESRGEGGAPGVDAGYEKWKLLGTGKSLAEVARMFPS